MLIFLRILQLLILYSGGVYLCYVPFREQLRFARWKMLVSVLFLLAGMISVYICLLLYVSDEASHIFSLVALPIYATYYLCSIKESPYRTVLVFLLVACYGAFVCGFSVFISNVVFDKGINYEILYTLASLLIGGGTYLIVHKCVVEQVMPIINSVSSKDLQSVCFIPLLYIILQMVLFTCYDGLEKISHPMYFVILICINVSTYFVVRDILNILNNRIDKMRMQEEMSINEKLLEIQKSQYASWITQIEAVRRARHDLKHHIAIIQSFVEKDDKVGLQEHIKKFQKTIPESSPMILCNHMNVNSILLHYYERAQKEKVKFEIIADIEEKISINAQDLAVIFGNCLENAFEACARMDLCEEKSVSLMAKPVGSGIAIIIDNTFDGQVVKEKDVYLSSKRSKQAGIGMASVKLIVQKYGGIVAFETEGNIFMTSIRLSGKTVLEEEKGGEE